MTPQPEFAVQICGICREAKPKHFLVCETCWAETPWRLKRDYWTAQANHHHHPKGWQQRFIDAMQTIILHLKQFSSAIP